MDSAVFRLSIPKPCHQDWNSMQKMQTGNYCSNCQKIVTDFTKQSDEDIQLFFRQNLNKSVCGRFRTEQLERITITIQQYVFHKPIAFWKKFLLLFLICFGTDLFRIEVISGNTNGLFAQTVQPQILKKAKKIKNKKLNLENTIELNIPADPEMVVFETLGFVITTPEVIPVQPVCIKQATDSSKNDDPVMAGAISTAPKKEKENVPVKNKTHQPLEFILPAITRMRRKKRIVPELSRWK